LVADQVLRPRHGLHDVLRVRKLERLRQVDDENLESIL
jgi:hypothetical protein